MFNRYKKKNRFDVKREKLLKPLKTQILETIVG